MLFNSFEFAVFLPLLFGLYWFVFKNLRSQNILVVIASYIFYGWWDWRFLSLILFSTLTDYYVGIWLAKIDVPKKRKWLLASSIIVNLGILGVFKYFNFFLDSLYNLNPGLQAITGFNTLDIILPVGISFYTFQTLSYSIDVYRRKLEPTTSFVDFAAFVSFFPQLVAGPIERATNLLPQFQKQRIFDREKATDGLKQILWGLFKKVVIADNCAIYANMIFDDSANYSGSTLLLGAFFFAFQIYGDFSGYSDIAIGTARLFGFNLMKNFAFPYFSRDIAEFWRRWHISLSTWFRDYLYIPLGGSRGGLWMKVRNTFIIFIVSGFWHGADWTFIIWGFLNALYFLPLLLAKKNRTYLGEIAEGRLFPSPKEALNIGVTFLLTLLAWVFFRAENVGHAFQILNGIFDPSLFSVPEMLPPSLFILLLAFMMVEWLGRSSEYAIQHNILIGTRKVPRYTFYYLIVFCLFYYGAEQQDFIYFQF